MKMQISKIELKTLYEISNILSSSLELSSTLRGVLRVISEYLNINKASVSLKIEDKIIMVAAYGISKEEMKRGVFKIGEGVIGKVVKNGIPIIIPDISNEPIFLNKTGSRILNNKVAVSFISVPIRFKSETLGALSVDIEAKEKITSFEDDLQLLKIVAALIAQTVKQKIEFEKEKHALEQERDYLKLQLKNTYTIKNMIAISNSMQEVFEAIHRVAPTKASVILLGESGTGKELAAKAIHFMSNRAEKPFIKFNCASIPEGLLESELFGHEKGAFTGATYTRKGRFELADGGTIFLDEIGDLPLSLQPKILRILQEREFERVGGEKTIKVDVRIIAATSRDLKKLVDMGRFREDLYYRLNVVPIVLPPLRERKEDIPLLIDHFLTRFNEENQKNISISKDAISILMQYDWQGNVRELENTIERLVIMSKKTLIYIDDLPGYIRMQTPAITNKEFSKSSLSETIISLERENIIKALKTTGGNVSKAAKIIGLTPRQVRYKMLKYNINSF